MKLMALAMLSAVIKRQHSSLFPLLRHCSPVFDEICVRQIRLEIMPEPNLAAFPKNGRIPDLPEPKSDTAIFMDNFPDKKAD